MSHMSRIIPQVAPTMSPLVLCDRLLRLAEEADHAGFPVAAEHLLYLANEVLDKPAEQQHEPTLRKH
jgi:hypothetical protein